MTLNQTKMVIQIETAAYGQPLSADRVKELAAVVGGGGLACRTVARQVAGLVPAVGWAVKSGVGYAGTWAMGMAAAQYFEHGGDMAGVGAVVDEARAAASRAADGTAAGRAAKGFVASLGLSGEKCCHGPCSCRGCAGAWSGRRSHACRCERRSICRAGCGHWCCPSGRCWPMLWKLRRTIPI